METLRSWRQPLAWLVIAATGATSLLSLVGMLSSGSSRGFLFAASSWAPSIMNAAEAMIVLAAVVPCILITPQPPQTKPLVITGLAVVGGFGALSLILSFLGLAAMTSGGGAGLVLSFLRQVASLAVVTAVTLVLVKFLQSLNSSAAHPGAITDGTMYGSQLGSGSQVGGTPTGYGSQVAPPAGVGSGTEHSQGWQPSADAGAMWGSARDAASGSQASGWGGTPGTQPGWSPAHTGTPHSVPPQHPQAQHAQSQYSQSQYPQSQYPQSQHAQAQQAPAHPSVGQVYPQQGVTPHSLPPQGVGGHQQGWTTGSLPPSGSGGPGLESGGSLADDDEDYTRIAPAGGWQVHEGQPGHHQGHPGQHQGQPGTPGQGHPGHPGQ